VVVKAWETPDVVRLCFGVARDPAGIGEDDDQQPDLVGFDSERSTFSGFPIWPSRAPPVIH
jgi:hypothetical protein